GRRQDAVCGSGTRRTDSECGSHRGDNEELAQHETPFPECTNYPICYFGYRSATVTGHCAHTASEGDVEVP
ncbi:MAG: hypothetical protein LPK23_01550, partial [Rhodococcus sp. (in: high G+C Gram-positive bacteria)]|nr:hypothetical protein [Rhodococcus sp. (in: high G+C Gram-positive bacteria)]MDX5451638.1 hypothetical protein [Rhodococcus sp. (in: high G+C Gram-positive bacteria)]